MIDKDNDFGLKKVNLKNYKIKKNNSSIIFLVFILLIATYFYSKKEIYFDDMSENKITIKEKSNNKFIDEKILNDDIKIIEDSSENSNDDEKIKNLEIRETFYTINKSSIENIKILEVDKSKCF